MTHSSNRRTAGGALVLVLALLAACGDSGDETTTEADSIAVLDTVPGEATDIPPQTGAVIDTQAPPDTEAVSYTHLTLPTNSRV